MFAFILHLSALAGLTTSASNDITPQAGFLSVQEATAGDTSTVEEIDLPDWMPIDSRGEWEHLYTRRLPTLQEDTQVAEDRQREVSVLLAEVNAEAEDPNTFTKRSSVFSALVKEMAWLGGELKRLRAERDRVESRLNQLTSLLHWPNQKYWALH